MQNGFTFINEVEVQKSAILTTPKSFLTRKKQEKKEIEIQGVTKTSALGMVSYPVSIGYLGSMCTAVLIGF
jgi:hypothetical protein